MLFTDALNHVLAHITHADGDALLTVTLTRLAIICANLPGAAGWLETFEREFRLERGRLNLQATLTEMDGIKRIKALIKP